MQSLHMKKQRWQHDYIQLKNILWNKHAASRVVNYELKNKMLENQTLKILILAESVTRHIQGV